ncbi:MAG: acyl-[acyl-carrier-protein] thioesterase [Parabacteroides sp.]
MKEKVGKYSFDVVSYQLDFQGRVPLPLLGNYLLHAASAHAADRGFGYQEMTEKRTAWVLSRMAIEVNHYPASSGEVTVYTWVDEVNRLFTSRCFEMQRDGKPFGYARSIWAAIDLESRRPTPLDEAGLAPYLSDRPCPITKPGKIMPVEAKSEPLPYLVKYSDLDINGHLNSIKYIEHLLDLFDIELFRTRRVSRFEIAYQSEGRYGMLLDLHLLETAPGVYSMAICHEDKSICRAVVNWQ